MNDVLIPLIRARMLVSSVTQVQKPAGNQLIIMSNCAAIVAWAAVNADADAFEPDVHVTII